MNLEPGTIIEVQQTLSTFYGIIVNRHRYRAFEGSMTWLQTQAEAIIAAFKVICWDKQKELLPNTVALHRMDVRIVHPTPDIAYTVTYATGSQNGSGGDPDETPEYVFDPRAAAVLERRSYVAGRRGIGRAFLGPVCARFKDARGLLKAAQTGFDGVVTFDTLKANLAADMTVNSAPQIIQFRPCIWSKSLPVTDDKCYLRQSFYGAVLAYHESRRWGRGA